jgi:hypothetical protein
MNAVMKNGFISSPSALTEYECSSPAALIESVCQEAAFPPFPGKVLLKAGFSLNPDEIWLSL